MNMERKEISFADLDQVAGGKLAADAEKFLKDNNTDFSNQLSIKSAGTAGLAGLLGGIVNASETAEQWLAANLNSWKDADHVYSLDELKKALTDGGFDISDWK